MESVIVNMIGRLFGSLYPRIRLVRILLHVLLTLGGLLFGYMSALNLAEEVRFSREGRQAIAEVGKYVHMDQRHSTGQVEVSYTMEGQKVTAIMVTNRFFTPNPGDHVPILYRTDKPWFVVRDSFWQRYFWPCSTLVFAAMMFAIGIWPIKRVLVSARRMDGGGRRTDESAGRSATAGRSPAPDVGTPVGVQPTPQASR